jgi:hypothetical protein
MSPLDEPTPPRPQRPTGQRLAVIVAAVVVICCGSLVGVFYGVRALVSSSTDPMRAAAAAFLDDLRARDYPAAFGLLCDATRDRIDLDALIEREAGRPLQDFSITGVYADDRSGSVDGRVTATLHFADGGQETRALPMVQEDDEWRVCGDPY